MNNPKKQFLDNILRYCWWNCLKPKSMGNYLYCSFFYFTLV